MAVDIETPSWHTGRMMNYTSTRRLVAVDLENLAHRAIVDVEWAVDAAYLLSTTLGLKEYDVSFVAGGPQNLEAVARVAKIMHGQPRIRAGADGADLALVDALEQMPVGAIESERMPITEVVVMSGDGLQDADAATVNGIKHITRTNLCQ